MKSESICFRLSNQLYRLLEKCFGIHNLHAFVLEIFIKHESFIYTAVWLASLKDQIRNLWCLSAEKKRVHELCFFAR